MNEDDLQIIEFEDPEKNALAEARFYEFLDWLNAQRRKYQAEVIALYPRLSDGVSAQEIQRVTENATFWNNVPDELAGQYAYQTVAFPKTYERHKVIAATLDMTVCEFWLDLHYIAYEEEDETEA